MSHDWLDQLLKALPAIERIQNDIKEIISEATSEKENPWTMTDEVKVEKTYDGESIKTDLTEKEQEDLLSALEELHTDDPDTILIPVDRDWAATFAFSIRQQERSLAERRLRARLRRTWPGMTTDAVNEIVAAINEDPDHPVPGEMP